MKIIRALALLCASVALSGCAVPFYWQAIGGQIELLRKRTPIEALIEDPALDATLRSKLSSVAAMRRFAIDELKLPDNKSYTTYVALDRSYVVWNVVAAKEFSVDPERWCFPFAGCVAYRGFFSRDAAERFQARLEAEGLDTYSGGSAAYSTLGYFADPVLSTMISGGEQYVASTLFHELAHQKLYIKGDSEFSEAFATVIEEYGTERWLMTHGTAADLDRYLKRRRHGADFGQLIAAQQARLREVYARSEPDEAKRGDKRAAFDALRADYAELKARWGGSGEYDAWFARPLNNAALAAVATYTRWVPALRSRLETRGLDAFYADAEALAELTNEERAARLRSWAVEPVSASR
ncbi:MAG TPA: aminopeptidase [Gammaproteobacteria bacterium]|nr:aminopeptidase [Gammaproteobacteria bacterium]